MFTRFVIIAALLGVSPGWARAQGEGNGQVPSAPAGVPGPRHGPSLQIDSVNAVLDSEEGILVTTTNVNFIPVLIKKKKYVDGKFVEFDHTVYKAVQIVSKYKLTEDNLWVFRMDGTRLTRKQVKNRLKPRTIVLIANGPRNPHLQHIVRRKTLIFAYSPPQGSAEPVVPAYPVPTEPRKKVDDTKRQKKVDDIKRQVFAAEAEVAMWKNQVGRSKRLVAKGYLSKTQLLQSERQLRAAENALHKVKQQLNGVPR